ncbi:MAG: CPBP family intramembrane metalloprotease [Cyanobacteria bacterium SZAS-4]|nr:CPBP family intramembrane metalloprotease [Cyanobacteria bacterium SZAS-4]
MRKFWIHPITQIVGYVALFLILLYGSWFFILHFFKMALLVELMLNEILEAIFCVLLLIFYVVEVQKRKFDSTGIVKRGVIVETVAGFALGLVVSGLTIFGMYMVGAYKPVGMNLQANLIYPFILFFFGAIVEEVIFRLFIFQTCERRWGTTPALVITSVSFGMVHLINTVQHSTFEQRLLGCMFLVFEAGFLLNALFLVNRRVWLPLGMHWAWNFFEGPIFGTIVSGQNFGASLLVAQTSGVMLASGGPFGPEGSASGLIVGVACGALAAWYSIKRGAWNQRLVETESTS